ncbi:MULTISPECIES: hypothetical protein [Aequorivita]|uniref:Lipoprotein n=2 Tax=Aequorivita TaxID=153265 RepID=A0AB35YRJ2_9FLAO|nr:hypothetical protein [Aequorivita sp. Ant34-E75]WGF92962.1 hypothetical protein QCQ61_01915 [Aequorivita sp. Ant34-E75]
MKNSKKMHYLKIIALSLVTGITIGCNIIQVSNVHSQIHRPGLPSGSPTINYSWKLSVEKPIEIKSVSLYKKSEVIKIPNYIIYDLKDGKIINGEKLPSGDYFIKFEISGNQLDPKEENIIQLEYIKNSTKNTLRFKSTKIADLLMK